MSISCWEIVAWSILYYTVGWSLVFSGWTKENRFAGIILHLIIYNLIWLSVITKGNFLGNIGRIQVKVYSLLSSGCLVGMVVGWIIIPWLIIRISTCMVKTDEKSFMIYNVISEDLSCEHDSAVCRLLALNILLQEYNNKLVITLITMNLFKSFKIFQNSICT